jgi:hypothetical protein
MRKAAIVVTAFLAGILLLVIGLPRIVSLDGMRPRIAAALEAKTGRKATLSGVSLSLFPGIGVRVRDLALSGDPGHESEKLLAVPDAEIRMAILPLLSGRVDFTRVILSGPAILFRRYADGSSSLTDLSAKLSRAPSRAPDNDADAPRFSLDTLELRSARVALRIQGSDGKESAYDVGDVNARIGGAGGLRADFDVSARIDGALQGHVALSGRLERERPGEGPIRLSAEGDLFRQDFKVDGKIIPGEGGPELDLAFSMPKARLADLPGMFRQPPSRLVDARTEGIASLSARLSGTPAALGFELDADLGKAAWTVQTGLQKFIDMPCTVVLQGHRFPDQVILSNAELRFPPLLLIGNLSAVPSTGAYEWRASSRIASLEEFARSRGELLQAWSPSGRLTASGKGMRAGKSTPASWQVDVDLGEVGFQHRPSAVDFRSLEGHLALTPGMVEFAPLSGLFNGQRFSLRGKLAQGDTATGPLELKMAYLDLDRLFPGGDHGQGAAPAKDKGAGRDEAGTQGKQKVAFRANLSVDAGRARGIEFRDLSGQVGFERGVHSFDRLRAKVYGGELSATGQIDARKADPGLRARISLRDVEASQILSRKTRLGDFVSGPVTMDVDLSGGIRDFAAFTRTATGEGTLSVTNGKIRGIDLSGEAARLAGISAALPAAPVRETPFRKLSADFRIAGGKVRTDALKIDSDRFGLYGSTAIGFDKTVDFVGTLRLPASLAGRVHGAAGKYLALSGGGIEIPLVVSGALTSPAMAIDSGALARGIARGAVKGLLGLAPGVLSAPAPAAPPGGEAPPAAAEGQRAIRGLIKLFDKAR